jgi:hypothetical protein
MKFKALGAWILLLLLFFTPMSFADPYPDQQAQPAFSQQELDQMLAPIALYPDALLSQILMAATYPLEVVEAARWSDAHPSLKGDQAVKAAEKNDWDPSVISLTAFPQVLAMMDEKLDWTERLGEAFLSQQSQVMDTVQELRQRAIDAGNLRSNDRIRIERRGQIIVIVEVAPQIIYVPYYDPTIVYGPWWWDAYPPVYWDPWPGYYYLPGFSVGFYWGSGITVSAGFFFGDCDWRHRRVSIVNVNNYYYNNYYTTHYYSNPVNRSRTFDATRSLSAPIAWQHDPDHRRGVPYRQPVLQQQFNHTGTSAEARHDYRGRNPSSRDTANQPAIIPGMSTAPRSRPETGNSRPERWNKAQPRDTNPEIRSNAIDQPGHLDMPESGRIRERSAITLPAAPPSNDRLMLEQRSRTFENTGPRNMGPRPDIGSRPDTIRSDSNQRLDTRSTNDRGGDYRQQESAPAAREMPSRGPEHNSQQQHPKSHSDDKAHGDK